MKFSRAALVAVALVAIGATSTEAASATALDRQFEDAVARILATVHNDYLDGLSAAQRRDFTACAQRVMAAAPRPRKQYVLSAPNQSEMRARFDEVAQDNQAALKKQITRQCTV